MTRSIILALNHPIGRIFIEEIDRSKIHSWEYSFINVPFADIGIMKCVQFFRSFLPSVENSLENCNILPFGRTRFSFENRERERNLCGASAARLSRIHSNWMNPLSVVRPHNTLLSPAGRCFLPSSNFPSRISVTRNLWNLLITGSSLIFLLFQQWFL